MVSVHSYGSRWAFLLLVVSIGIHPAESLLGQQATGGYSNRPVQPAPLPPTAPTYNAAPSYNATPAYNNGPVYNNVPANANVLRSNASTAPASNASAYTEVPSSVETLEDAWLIALREDQRVQAGQWTVASSESSQASAQAEYFPSVQLGANAYALSDQPTYSMSLLGMSVETPLVDRNSGGFSAVMTQPIYTFGRISNGVSAAQQTVHANQSDLARTKLDVKMNVAEIYVVSLRAGRLIEVAESKVISLESHTKDVARFFDKGIVSKNDLLAAQVALADARLQALQVHNMQRVAHAAYNRALGRELSLPVRLAELQTGGAPGDIDELTRTAMQTRPEIAALSWQARALRDQAASTDAKKAPQVAVMGGYLYQGNQYVDPNGLAGVMVGVNWTPFDSGRVSNQANSMRQKAESVIRMRKDAESMIALEVRQKWLDQQTALERVEVARQATAQADDNLRVALDRYQHQVGTNTEVLDAETLRVQAFTNFYNSSYEAVLAELRLRRAVGNL
jgi:outer membrane protein TolC